VTTKFHPDCRLSIPPHVLVRLINGESFILNVETECYFGLNAVGSRMLELLAEGRSVGAVFEQLQVEYEVDGPTLLADLEHLLEELLQYRLLERSGETPEQS
jgi:hypothetical protein